MIDLATEMRRALDQVRPVTVDDIEATAKRRRSRRKRVFGSGGVAVAAVAAVLATILVARSGSTTVTTKPVGSVPTSTTPATLPATLTGNPLFSVIRAVPIPDGTTGALFADGSVFTWSNGGFYSSVVARVDPAAGRVTATAKMPAGGAAFAGHLLWLTSYSQPGEMRVADVVVALDPDSLAVVHRLSIPDSSLPSANRSGENSIALAGRLLWVTGASTLYGIDPSTAAIVRRVPLPPPPPFNGFSFRPGQYQIEVAANEDGTVLWTVETPAGGGFDGLQVRDPNTGAVIESGSRSVLSLATTRIAAAGRYAWIAFISGSSGSYIKINNLPGLPPAATQPSITRSSALSLSIVATTMWIYDPETSRVACADPNTGAIRKQADLAVNDIIGIENGQIAVIDQEPGSAATLAIAVPKPPC